MARRDIDRLQGEIEELFSDLWQVPRFSGLRRGFRPAVDCFVTSEPHELVVVVELAGVDADSVEIVVAGHTLTITGERRRPRVEGQVYEQAEIEYGRFERRIQLEAAVDTAAAAATYADGMLRISLPIVARPRRGRTVSIAVRHAE
jgi:HSP20 family protein